MPLLVGQGPLFELLEEAAAGAVPTEGSELAEALAVKENAQTYLAEGSAGVEEAQQKEAGTTELQQGLPPDGDATVAAEQQAADEAPPGGDGAKGPQAFYDHGVHEALIRGYRERGIVGERAADELARLRWAGDELSASHVLSRTSALEAYMRLGQEVLCARLTSRPCFPSPP